MTETRFILTAVIILITSLIGGAFSMGLFAIGQEGYEAVIGKKADLDPERWEQLQNAFEKYGVFVLLLCAVPVISPVVVMGAGFFGFKKWIVFVGVVVGRILRYAILALLVWLFYMFIRR